MLSRFLTNSAAASESALYRQSKTDLFKGRHFKQEIIVLCVRWYLRYKLSYRDLVEMLAESGLSIAHTTILRWVRRYAQEFDKRWSRFAAPAYAASHRAARELQEQGWLPDLTKLRSSKYLNNLIEQDHRNVKSRLRAMLGLKSFASAATTIHGVELMHRIRNGQFDLHALAIQGQTTPEIWAAVLAA